MFLQQLPDSVRWVLLFATGAILGGFSNLAIYELSWYRRRKISPWSKVDEDKPARMWLDRIPIIGWWYLRRESDQYGTGFWVRPLLIELATGCFLVWFYEWVFSGGMFDHQVADLEPAQKVIVSETSLGSLWFCYYSVFILLLTINTFIDFDDQTIPDWITLPGTLFAILVTMLFPSVRLPVVTQELGGIHIEPLAFSDPGPPVVWHLGNYGAFIAIAIVLIWCFALVPKIVTIRYGIVQGIRLMVASVLRPKRRSRTTVPRIKNRRMSPLTKISGCIAVFLPALIVGAWLPGGESWNGLFDSMLGLAMGGGIVWAIRIVAGYALRVEAMGFGDVTLMCMIGAFMGWQPALLIFAIAPFASILVALVQVLVSGDNRLAFGPYLCIAAVTVLIGWNFVWNDWAAPGIFALGGQFLLVVLLVCLVLFGLMLGGWGMIKNRYAKG